jgi:hypothetical protein
MRRPSSTLKPFGAVLLGTALAGALLTGCGQAAEELVEQGIEQETGGDVELDDGNVRVDDGQGNEFSVGGEVELPDSWPQAVPTPDGTLILAGSSDGGANQTASWQTSGSAASATAAYGAALTAAGFTQTQQVDLGAGLTTLYSGNGFEVSVVATGNGSEASLSVTVVSSG